MKEKQLQTDLEEAYSGNVSRSGQELTTHSQYMREKYVSSLVREGRVDDLRELMEQLDVGQVVKLSKNPYRQQLYAIIIGIAMATRAAMDGGVDEEEAYGLSDLYVQETDACTDTGQLWKLYVKCLLDFAERVSHYQSDKHISEAVKRTQDYILRRAHFTITLKELAEHVSLSENYLSATFKKETGESIVEFVQSTRVREAKSLLQYSEYSLAEISEYLGFSSQSHFTKVFRKFAGCTPQAYRKEHFSQSW